MVSICKECGKSFETRNRQQVLCSAECRILHKKKYKRELAVKLKKEIRICKVCGNEFIPVRNNARTCSDICKCKYKEKKKIEKTGIEPAWMIDRKARAMGMSYGKYVAYMEGRIRKNESTQR